MCARVCVYTTGLLNSIPFANYYRVEIKVNYTFVSYIEDSKHKILYYNTHTFAYLKRFRFLVIIII